MAGPSRKGACPGPYKCHSSLKLSPAFLDGLNKITNYLRRK